MLSTHRIEITTTSTDAHHTLNQPILLKKASNKMYQIAFLELTTSYSWTNISADDGNNVLKYDNGVDATETITFNDGIWTVDSINEFIFAFCLSAGDTYTDIDGEVRSPIVFSVNSSKGVLDLFVHTDFTVDFTTGTLYSLLGFSSTTYTAGSYTGSTLDITNGQSRCLIQLSIISNTIYDASSSNIIYSFAPDQRPYELITEKPQVPVYLPLDVSYISNFRLSLMGTDGRPIRNNGEQFNIVFHIIEVDIPE